MRREAATGAGLWVVILIAAAATVFVGAPSAPAHPAPPAGFCLPAPCPTTTTTAPPRTTSTSSSTSTTSTTSTTTVATPTTVPDSPYSVGFQPCGGADAAGPCTLEPTRVVVGYTGNPPGSVQLAWKPDGRPSSAPQPTASSVTMQWQDGTACGSAQRCFPWPTQVTDGGVILNGSYQLVVCDSQGCKSPVGIGLAAPPAAPTRVQARASGPSVTVSWLPPPAAPPDLIGYSVLRGDRPIYSCSVDGLGPSAAVRCPPSLAVADRPGNGSFTYSVTAQRLGSAANGQDVVSSAPAGAAGPVTVPGQATATGAQGAGPGASFSASPLIGGAGAAVTPGAPVSLAPAGQAAGGSGASPEPGESAAPQNLQYPSDDPVVGKSAMAVNVGEHAAKTDVVPLGVLAIGFLILAVAAHVLYLREQLSVIQARLASARGGHA